VTIVSLTGITDDILAKKGVPIKKVFKKINELLGDRNCIIVGHNILCFDNLFLNYYLKLFGYKAIERDQCFDTAGQMKSELLELHKQDEISWAKFHASCFGKSIAGLHYTLSDALKYYNINHKHTLHNALSDVNATYKVFKAQMKKNNIKFN
jgi:DNA polymerase III epsilon subunit-like protein